MPANAAAASDALASSFNNVGDSENTPSEVADFRSFRECADATIDGVAWPTIILSLASIAGFLIVTGAAITGALPFWAAALLNIPCFFVAYTGFHEAVHRNFHGRREGYDWLNTAFGTVFGFMFFYPYAMHSYIHLTHHANTNNPEKDPDHWMHGNTPWVIALRGITLIPYYIVFTARMRGKEPGATQFFRRVAIEEAAPLTVFILLILAGHWQVAVFTWFLTYVVSVAILGVVFDWIVHHPHDDQTPFGGTRTFRARKGWRSATLNWLHLFQNYHLIHHLHPRVPFYRHEEVFDRSEAFLRSQGATIIDV